jgi:hypothetical protein
MAVRQVTGVIRDDKGRTVALTNAAESWSPVTAGHAARQIEAQLHSYIATSAGGMSSIGVVDGPTGPYLRSLADGLRPDNLDSLPSVVGHPLTGAFDLVIEIDEASLQTALTAMHASGAIAHRASVVEGSDVAVLSLGAPAVRLIETTTSMASCEVRTPFVAWVRRRDNAADAGYTESGFVSVPAVCFAITEADGSFTLATNWRGVQPSDVSLQGTSSAEVQARVRTAVVAWARDAGGRYPIPSAQALGTVAGTGMRFARASGGGVGVQLGLDVSSPIEPMEWPAPTGSPLRVALSGRWVAARVMERLRSYWGTLPPPYGQGVVDLGVGPRLSALDVDLGYQSLTFTGRLQSGLISAFFTATIGISGNTPGSVKASSVGAVGGNGTDRDGVSVDITDLMGRVADFLSGGAFKRALTEGIRSVLAKDGGGLAALLSRTTVRATAAAGSAAAVNLDTKINSTSVTAFGVVLQGALSAGAPRAVSAQLDAISLGGSWRLLSLMSSWAPGDHIAAVSIDFGDGQSANLTGPNLALAIPHEYAPGSYTARVTVTDRRGRTASATTRVRVI